jgi:hypothetical protein
MSTMLRRRNPTDEAREREMYRILSHVAACTRGDCTLRVLCSRVADALQIRRLEAAALIEELIRADFCEDGGAGPSVRLSTRGRDYLERHAGRRRSVRDPGAAFAR